MPVGYRDRLAAATAQVRPEVLVVASVALGAWLLGHVDGTIASVAIPLWLVAGLALGVMRPDVGLAITILVVPFKGDALGLGPAELLRVVPVLGAGARVVVDRLNGHPRTGAPSGWAVALVAAGMGMHLLSGFTAAVRSPHPEAAFLEALPWLLGAPIALLAAWLVSAHVPEERLILDITFIATAFACVIAVVAWAGLPLVDALVYPPDVSGRLAAFGFPTPTAMGLAIALPLAVGAAGRRHVGAGLAVLLLGFGTIVLTGSRGPLVALGLAAATAAAVARRLSLRWIALGVLLVIIAVVTLFLTRYRGESLDEILGSMTGAASADALRVSSWIAAIEIALRDPLVGGGWRPLARYTDVELRGIADSHNMILAAFASGGLPLGLAFAGFIGYATRRLWAARRHLSPFTVAAAVTLLIAGLWDIPQLRSYGAVMGGVALGLASRRQPPMTDPSPGRGRRRRGRPSP